MLIEVNTTCGNEAEARRIARQALEQHLCACAHILPVESHYWWQGSIQHGSEFRLILKTVSGQYEKLSALIVAEYGYDLPPIYATPIDRCSAAYARWIESNSSG